MKWLVTAVASFYHDLPIYRFAVDKFEMFSVECYGVLPLQFMDDPMLRVAFTLDKVARTACLSVTVTKAFPVLMALIQDVGKLVRLIRRVGPFSAFVMEAFIVMLQMIAEVTFSSLFALTLTFFLTLRLGLLKSRSL